MRTAHGREQVVFSFARTQRCISSSFSSSRLLSIRRGGGEERKEKEGKEKGSKREEEEEAAAAITSFAFSRCISRSASWIPSRDRPREYRLSWPLDTIPDPFAITRMHRTQRQCLETIRDCRHGVTRTYTCTHADIPVLATLSLLLRCCTLLRGFVLPRTSDSPGNVRERERYREGGKER